MYRAWFARNDDTPRRGTLPRTGICPAGSDCASEETGSRRALLPETATLTSHAALE